MIHLTRYYHVKLHAKTDLALIVLRFVFSEIRLTGYFYNLFKLIIVEFTSQVTTNFQVEFRILVCHVTMISREVHLLSFCFIVKETQANFAT